MGKYKKRCFFVGGGGEGDRLIASEKLMNGPASSS